MLWVEGQCFIQRLECLGARAEGKLRHSQLGVGQGTLDPEREGGLGRGDGFGMAILFSQDDGETEVGGPVSWGLGKDAAIGGFRLLALAGLLAGHGQVELGRQEFGIQSDGGGEVLESFVMFL
jgi:hypothetical protein